MRRVAELMNEMLQAGVVLDYAVFGAVAQMRYTEAVATLDADILVKVTNPEALDVLAPLYAFCRERGYEPEGEAIRVADWPVQLIPAFDPLTAEAMREAETADFEGVPLRVVRADHLACIALSVGRPKDHARVLALRESGAATDAGISALAERHGLAEQWLSFRKRFDEE
jgi:hypothetical protein